MLSNEPILLIEDNLSDIENITQALKAMELKSPLIHIRTCEEAIVYLNDKNKLQPGLILLGLNEQNSDCLDFLKTIKANENLRQIPIVIFAFSNEQYHVDKSFKLGVAGYIVKSEDVSKLNESIKTMIRYWTLSELPPVGDRHFEGSCYISR